MEKQKNDPSRDKASHVDVHDKDYVPQNVVDQNFNCLIKNAYGKSTVGCHKRSAALFKKSFMNKYPTLHVNVVKAWNPYHGQNFIAPKEIVNDQSVSNFISYVYSLIKKDGKGIVPHMRMVMKYVSALCVAYKLN